MQTLYLDTSDLSYLVKGRGPRSGPDIGETRERLLALVRAERVRLCVSFVHFAEMAVNGHAATAALGWVDSGTPVWCFTTGPEAIFRAELLGERVPLDGQPLTRALVESIRVGGAISGRHVAHGVKGMAWLWASAENLSKKPRRRPPGMSTRDHRAAIQEQARNVDRVLRGDVDGLPGPARWMAKLYRPVAQRLLARNGLSLDDLRTQQQPPAGCVWITGMLPPAEWKRAVKRLGTPNLAPASAMRAAIEKWEHDDAKRVSRSGLPYDMRHLAYAARCDFSTIDGPNHRETRKVREQLSGPRFFPTGAVHEVVEAIESGV